MRSPHPSRWWLVLLPVIAILWCTGLVAQAPPAEPTPPDDPAETSTDADPTGQTQTPTGAGFEDKRLNRPEQDELDQARKDRTGGPSFWTVFRMLFFVVLIIALIYGLAWFLRSVANRRTLFGASSAARVLNRLPLTAKHVLVTVRLGGRILVLGLGPEGVSRISEIDDPDEVEALTVDLASGGSSLTSFSRFFRGQLEQDQSEQTRPQDEQEQAVEQARNELESIRETIRQWDRSSK